MRDNYRKKIRNPKIEIRKNYFSKSILRVAE
jgi:hypothetical protein